MTKTYKKVRVEPLLEAHVVHFTEKAMLTLNISSPNLMA